MFINMFLFILNKPQRTPREKIINKNRRFVLMTINTYKSGEIFKRGAKKCSPLKWRFEKMRGYRGEEKLLLHQKFVLSPNLSFPLIFLFLPSRFQGHFCPANYKYQEQYLFHQYNIHLRLNRT